MKMKRWLFAAAAVAVAIALAGCPTTVGNDNGNDNGDNGGNEDLIWDGGFSLASHLATLDVGEDDHDVIFGDIPFVRAGGDDHVSFEVILHEGRNALQVTVTQDWAGFDILHRHGSSMHFDFQPGDYIRIAGEVVSPAANRIGLGYGQTAVWFQNWQSDAGEPFDESFTMAAGNIAEMVSREGPDGLRVRGNQGVANSVFIITDLIVRDPSCPECGEYPCDCAPVEYVTVTAYGGATTVASPGTLQFAAAVGPEGASQAVVWSVNPAVEGASINATGLLTIAEGTPPGTVSVRATAVGTDIYGYATVTIPSFGISLSAAGMVGTSLGFGFFNIEDTPVEARVVTIANTGNQPTGALTVVSSAPAVFAVAPAELPGVPFPAGETPVTFTVTPYAGLTVPAGESEHEFTANITVDGANIAPFVLAVTLTLTTEAIITPTAVTITAPAENNAPAPRGGTLDFVAALYPEDATGDISWEIVGEAHGAEIAPATGASVVLDIPDAAPVGTTLTIRAVATVGDEYDTRTVLVSYPAPASFTVAPPTPSVGPTGGTVNFTATPVPAYANPSVTWSIPVDAPDGVAIVAATGVLTVGPGVTPGNITVTATSTVYAGATGTATLTVDPPLSQTLGDFISFTGYEVTAPDWLEYDIKEGGTLEVLGPLQNDGVEDTSARWVYYDGGLILHQTGRSDRDHGIIMLNSAFDLQARDVITVRARIYPAQTGWAAIVQNADTDGWSEQGQSPNASAGGIVTSIFTVGEDHVSLIAGGTPPGIRIGPNGANNADMFIYSITVYRPDPPPPPGDVVFDLQNLNEAQALEQFAGVNTADRSTLSFVSEGGVNRVIAAIGGTGSGLTDSQNFGWAPFTIIRPGQTGISAGYTLDLTVALSHDGTGAGGIQLRQGGGDPAQIPISIATGVVTHILTADDIEHGLQFRHNFWEGNPLNPLPDGFTFTITSMTITGIED